MALKVTIRPYNCFDEPDPPFQETSKKSIHHVRITVFEGHSTQWLSSLFERVVVSIQRSVHKKMLVEHTTQTKEQRFCKDFHLDDDNSDKVKQFMEFIQQELRKEGWFEVSIKPRSDDWRYQYSST